ncbi:MAG: hypothetical protein HQM13_11510 [SAR324 cluster bacterium]|nr:hypothetical protein [SAR324 cluster bacterium]
MKCISPTIWKLAFFFCFVGLTAGFLTACGTDEELHGCDFTEKLVSVSIDEKRKLLVDNSLLELTLEELQAFVEKEEVQRQQKEIAANSARPAGTPYYHQPLSKEGKKALVKIDLLQKIKNNPHSGEREKWLELYNHLRWGDLVTERAYLQECEERIVLKPEKTLYQTQSIESHFIDEEVSEIPLKNLYYAYSTPEEVAELNDSTKAYQFLHPKTGRGFSTGFFVEDLQDQTEWKVKVGWEAYREPLATRIAWALGFYVDEVFHVRELRVKFDGFLEQLFEDKGRKIEDSLSSIILYDGTEINLIAGAEKRVDSSGIYQSYRSQIRFLVFKSVVLERRDSNIVRAGQWSFDALGNPGLRAVRMMGLLNFWIGNPDIKFDNNRIFLRCSDPELRGKDVFKNCIERGDYHYQFVVHDLGLAFAPHPNELNVPGHELDIRRDENGQVSIFSNTRGRDVYAWRNITREDAHAFGTRLAQLTEIQLRQAVAASGYPYPALMVMVEKLKDRRNRFLEALNENFLPMETDLLLSNRSSGKVTVGDGETVTVPHDDFILVNGFLENDISLENHGRHSEMIRE